MISCLIILWPDLRNLSWNHLVRAKVRHRSEPGSTTRKPSMRNSLPSRTNRIKTSAGTTRVCSADKSERLKSVDGPEAVEMGAVKHSAMEKSSSVRKFWNSPSTRNRGWLLGVGLASMKKQLTIVKDSKHGKAALRLVTFSM